MSRQRTVAKINGRTVLGLPSTRPQSQALGSILNHSIRQKLAKDPFRVTSRSEAPRERALLTTQADLKKLKADLQQPPELHNIEALCARYGILIPQLWEEPTFHFGDPVYSGCLTACSLMPNIRWTRCASIRT